MPPAVAPASCAVERLGLVEYGEAWALQRRLVEACRGDGQARLLLLEHPHTYTLGPRGRAEHILLSEDALANLGAAVHRVDRGGDVTYHGPGQLVGYPILDLRRWHQGPNWYVRSLEATLVGALASFGIAGQRKPGCVGVWAGDAKIASIGVRVSRGITSHGFALNVDPDLDYFSHIVPCGLPDVRVTSMAQVSGAALSMDDVMDAVERSFGAVFELAIDDPAVAFGHRGRPDGRPYGSSAHPGPGAPLQVAEATVR